MPLANHASEPVVNKSVTKATMYWFGLVWFALPMLRVLHEVSKFPVLQIATKGWILGFFVHFLKVFIVLFHTFSGRISGFSQWLWRQAFKILPIAPIRMSP